MTASVKVVYIVGTHRSGSTVFDAVLGDHDQVESVGELMHASRVWGNEAEYCACGELASHCPYWAKVRERWHQLLDDPEMVSDWPALQENFERIRYIPRVIREGRAQSAAFVRYSEGVRTLYQAIAEVSGVPVVVDSSKNPVRALALSYVRDVDLRLLHLVRDGRGVAWSMMKAYKKAAQEGIQKDLKPRPIALSALSWWLMNRLSEVSKRRLEEKRVLTLRYEDFVGAPMSVLPEIERLTGLDYTRVIEGLDSREGVSVRHTIAGNRVRMDGKITLKPDMEWMENLSFGRKLLFWIIAGLRAKQYGYRFNPGGSRGDARQGH